MTVDYRVKLYRWTLEFARQQIRGEVAASSAVHLTMKKILKLVHKKTTWVFYFF